MSRTLLTEIVELMANNLANDAISFVNMLPRDPKEGVNYEGAMAVLIRAATHIAAANKQIPKFVEMLHIVADAQEGHAMEAAPKIDIPGVTRDEP